ncbi:MAG TPA: hypothetical protein VF681_06105 [Abditibacteriaceae bacterium]|jgi:hypothetical protein
MSIKIDLLPGYVKLRRVRKGLAWGSAAFIAGTAGVLFALYYQDSQRLATMQENRDNIEPFALAAEKAAAATTKATDATAPMAALVSFLVASGRTGSERAALLDLISRYIYSGAVISAIDVSDGQNAKITATVQTPEDYGNLLLSLRNGSKSNGGLLFAADPKTNMVTASGVPGFPAAAPVVVTPGEQPQVIPFPLSVNITGVLQNPVKLPVEPGGAAPAADANNPNPGGPPQGTPPA